MYSNVFFQCSWIALLKLSAIHSKIKISSFVFEIDFKIWIICLIYYWFFKTKDLFNAPKRNINVNKKISNSFIYRFSEDFSVDESGSQENDLDMVIRKLTYDKLKLEIQLLELKIKRRREDSHPSTS